MKWSNLDHSHKELHCQQTQISTEAPSAQTSVDTFTEESNTSRCQHRRKKNLSKVGENWTLSLSALIQHTFTVPKHTQTHTVTHTTETYTSSSSRAEPGLNEASGIKMFRGDDWKACLFMRENPSSGAFSREKTDMKNEQWGQRANCCLALKWKNLADEECVWVWVWECESVSVCVIKNQ